jgi:hypothetical protein
MAGITINSSRIGRCAIDGCENNPTLLVTMWLRFCVDHKPEITVDTKDTWDIKVPKLSTDCVNKP